MLQCIVRTEAAAGIPAETTRDEIEESFVVTLQGLPQILGAWPATAALGRNGKTRLAQGIEEQLLSGTLLNQVLLGRSEDFHYTCQLLLFIFTGENGIPGE